MIEDDTEAMRAACSRTHIPIVTHIYRHEVDALGTGCDFETDLETILISCPIAIFGLSSLPFIKNTNQRGFAIHVPTNRYTKGNTSEQNTYKREPKKKKVGWENHRYMFFVLNKKVSVKIA